MNLFAFLDRIKADVENNEFKQKDGLSVII